MEVVELADGNRLPLLGLGVWQVKDGKVCEDAVRWALELGYRHIDTAQLYRNEASVGRALKDSGVARDEVFITTKFNPGIPFSPSKDPAAELEKSLRRARPQPGRPLPGALASARPALGMARHGAGAGARPHEVDRRVQLQRGRGRRGPRRRRRRARG